MLRIGYLNRLSRWVSLVVMMTLPFTSIQAKNINTGTIVASSASTSCLEYQVVGMCFWLYCGWSGCRIKTSVKVKHFIPELVVSAYQNTGGNPWSEMSSLSKPNNLARSGGSTTESDQKTHSNLRFKNADAIGHPSAAFFSLADKLGYSCAVRSEVVTPLFPHYLSTLDTPAWRYGIPEMFYPEALIPGRRELKKNGDMWGNLFPRSGFVNQPHDYKAAALTAQKVADFVTRKNQPHVYKSASYSGGGKGYWPPGPVNEGKTDHKWQMLAPKTTKSCRIWPDKSSAFGATDPYSSRIDKEGAYAWALWRPYMCCKKRGKFLYSVGS